MSNDKYISVVEEQIKYTSTPDVAQAYEKACDALAFSQSLWNVLGEQCFHQSPEDSEPDYNLMESAIDAINGELAAACLFLASLEDFDIPKLLEATGNKISLANESKAVPLVVLKGFDRLAERIRNTRAILIARGLSSSMKKAQ